MSDDPHKKKPEHHSEDPHKKKPGHHSEEWAGDSGKKKNTIVYVILAIILIAGVYLYLTSKRYVSWY